MKKDIHVQKEHFKKLVIEARKEYINEKDDRTKDEIKRIFKQLEMAKATVSKLEAQLKNLTDDEVLFLE